MLLSWNDFVRGLMRHPVGDSAQEVTERLTAALTTVSAWGDRNRVQFDKKSDKRGYAIFSRKSQPLEVDIQFGDALLTRRDSQKHFGVFFDSRLTFSTHVTYVKAKA